MAKKKEPWKEMLNLEERQVELKDVFFDPNNPRFASVERKPVPESRAEEIGIQQECLRKIKEEIGINDLKKSISTVGFLPLDRIVLRELPSKKYVVVEGNRRIASLKELWEENKAGEITLPKIILDSFSKINVLIYKGKEKDISWSFQGLRHLSGIKEWPPLQQGKFLKALRDIKKLSPTTIASMVGLKTRKVNDLIRGYCGYSNVQKDEDYGELVEPSMFSIIHEGFIKKPTVKEWLGWNDKKEKFSKKDRLKTLLSLFVPDEDTGQPKLPVHPTSRDMLPDLIEHQKVLHQLLEGKITSRDVWHEIKKEEEETEKERLEEEEERLLLDRKLKEISVFTESVKNLPTSKIKKERKNEFIETLKRLVEEIREQVRLLEM